MGPTLGWRNAATCLIAAWLSPAQAQDRPVPPVALCLSDFAPLNAATLPGGGPLGQIAVQAFARSGIRAELHFMPWARVVKEAEAAHCVIAGLWRNEARDQLFAYAGPFFEVELGYFSLRGLPAPGPKVSESDALRICVQRGTYLPAALQAVQTVLQANTDLTGCLRMLGSGRVEFAFGARVAGQYFLDSVSGQDLRSNIEWRGPALEVKEHLLAIRKTHPQRDALIQAFNRGLASLRADGSYQQLLVAGGVRAP